MRKLLLLVFLVACSRETVAPETPVAPVKPAPKPVDPPKVAETVERGAFVVTREGKILYREQFARSAKRLEADIAASGENARVLQLLELNPDATVRSATVETQGGAGKSETMRVAVADTRALVEVVDRKGVPASSTVTIPRGAIPNLVPESLAVLEQVIRRAKVLGGKQVRIPVLPGTMRPQWVYLTMTAPDSVQIDAASARIDAKIDGEGRLLSASEPNQKITIRRE